MKTKILKSLIILLFCTTLGYSKRSNDVNAAQTTHQQPAKQPSNQGGATFTTDKKSYSPGEIIRITVSGVTKTMTDNSALICIFRVEKEYESVFNSVYIGTISSTVFLEVPDEIGNYELRMYKDNLTSNPVYVVSINVVSASQPVAPAIETVYGNEWIKMEKKHFEPGERFVVTVYGITAQMEKDICWISIYQKGAPHTSFGEYYYPKQGTSRFIFTSGNGYYGVNYEIRLYRSGVLDDIYTDANLITSVPFTVPPW